MSGDRIIDCLKDERIETDCLGNGYSRRREIDRPLGRGTEVPEVSCPSLGQAIHFEAFQRRCSLLLIALLCTFCNLTSEQLIIYLYIIPSIIVWGISKLSIFRTL